MASTRPYKLVFRGQHYIVEAANAALAVQHVVGEDVTELRPARAAEVTAWMREKRDILVADGKLPVADRARNAPPAAAVDPDFAALADMVEAGDAQWHLDFVNAWGRIRAAGRMTLEDFDLMRAKNPMFAEAIRDFGAAVPAVSVDQVRASLEESPLQFADVEKAVGEAMVRYANRTSPAEPAAE